ncbi:MAG: hypothetical protein QOJ50_544, partial [Cryptosporangiaceae bacterium]|nr:hypothetical protein [Cryptosporangiaceae bacterium]
MTDKVANPRYSELERLRTRV